MIESNPLEDLEAEQELESTNPKTPWHKTKAFKISSMILGIIAIALIVLFNKPIGDLLNSLLLKAARQIRIISLNFGNMSNPGDGFIIEDGKLKLAPPIPATKIDLHIAAYFIPTQIDLNFIASRFSVIIGSMENGAYVADFLKSVNPSIITLGYRDAVMMNESADTHKDWDEVNTHEDWFVHEVDCSLVPNPCSPENRIQEPQKGGYLMDVGSAEWRAHYANYVVEKLNSPSHINYDGVFADDVWQIIPWSGWLDDKHPLPQIRTDWYDNMVGMVSYVKSQLPTGKKIIINTTPNVNILNQADGMMHEAFVHAPWIEDDVFKTVSEWKKDVDALISGIATGKHYLAQSGMLGTTATEAEKQQMMLFTLSSYLLGSGNKSTYSFKPYHQPGYNQVFFYPEWNVDLGTPTSTYGLMNTGDHIYKREFSKGLVLVNPSTTTYTNVNLGKSYKTLEGQTVDHVDIPPHYGIILQNS